MRRLPFAISLFALLVSGPPRLVAARFVAIGAGGVTDTASGVSPDGSTVLVGRQIWTAAGGLADTALADLEIYSRDISNNGVIAGLWCGPNTGSCYEAFRSTIDGPVEGLGALDDWSSDAFALTPDGSVIVGRTSSITGEQSFRWTSATGMVGIGNLDPDEVSHSAAYGVSADGSVVVGQSGDDMILEAYRWTESSGMVGLGDFTGGSFNSTAQSISADGKVIVGSGTNAQGTEAFRWTQESGMQPLGDLTGGDFYSVAYATNVTGSVIVGQSRATPVDGHAFIWTPTDGMRSLQNLLIDDYGQGEVLAGWTLSMATDISDDGRVIVGYGENPQGHSQAFAVFLPVYGDEDGDSDIDGADFLLWQRINSPIPSLPVPEPSTFAIAAACLGGLALVRRRRRRS